MSSTLTAPPVAAVLDRLLRTESENDEKVFAESGLTRAEFARHDAAERAELAKDIYMSVSREGGELLYLLARATGATMIVEFGCSYGVSAIHLAAAIRDNSVHNDKSVGGQLITTELEPGKAAAATASIADAGLAELVDIRLGDARETLRVLPDSVDLLLLDGWPDLRLPILRLVEPRLRAGALVLVDDIDLDFGPEARDSHREFLAYAADPVNGYQSLRLPIGDGIQALLRIG